MLNQFLDLKSLCVATKSMCLAYILKKILRILSFGGHLGRHLEYFNFPNDAKVASFSFNVPTYWRTHLCKNILCGLFFWVAPKIFIWQPDYCLIFSDVQYAHAFRFISASRKWLIVNGYTYRVRNSAIFNFVSLPNGDELFKTECILLGSNVFLL